MGRRLGYRERLQLGLPAGAVIMGSSAVPYLRRRGYQSVECSGVQCLCEMECMVCCDIPSPTVAGRGPNVFGLLVFGV